MRRYSTLPALFIGSFFLAACAGGEEAAMAETGTEMEVATSNGLECYLARGTMAEAQERPSPLRETAFSVGGNDGLLCYGAPSARGREIMGGLLVYGQPERIGANEPTTIHLSGPANVGGVQLEPGSYSLYAIPMENEWEFFINSNWERWGIPIDEAVRASEVGSFTAEPAPMDEYVETLQYRFEPMDGEMGNIVLEWENTRVSFHVHPGM
ncbi:MAG: DUF2911 domain-containing protein [Gemmatimonadota bacterium]|nr:DUF2911 domain-containing protein [Gemmatimonadota bacterium]